MQGFMGQGDGIMRLVDEDLLLSNKYQEALDTIKENEDEFYTIEPVWEAIEVLQELIDIIK